MADTKLNDLVRAYHSSGEGRELVLERVAALVYEKHNKYGFEDEDDAANALLKYRGRIIGLIDRFEDRGLPFDVYLATSLRFLARTVRRERRRILERESVCERASYNEVEYVNSDPVIKVPLEIDEEPCTVQFSEHPGRGPMSSKRRPRARGGLIPNCPAEAAAYSSRLVFLAVKCAWEIDEEGVECVSAAAGVGRDWLAAAIEQARRSLEPERSRVEYLVERRNACWTRLRLLETRFSAETDHYAKSRLSQTLKKEWTRFTNVRKEISSVRPIVPNSVVARILGIPKGTVDSGLYYLRKLYGS